METHPRLLQCKFSVCPCQCFLFPDIYFSMKSSNVCPCSHLTMLECHMFKCKNISLCQNDPMSKCCLCLDVSSCYCKRAPRPDVVHAQMSQYKKATTLKYCLSQDVPVQKGHHAQILSMPRCFSAKKAIMSKCCLC